MGASVCECRRSLGFFYYVLRYHALFIWMGGRLLHTGFSENFSWLGVVLEYVHRPRVFIFVG